MPSPAPQLVSAHSVHTVFPEARSNASTRPASSGVSPYCEPTPTMTSCPETAGDDHIAGWPPGALTSQSFSPRSRSMAETCPSRLPKITVLPAIVGEPERRPKPSACQILVPVLRLNAATTPPALAATTTPPLTTGVPFTGPTSSACQTAFRRLMSAAVRVAAAGCPSRARSPRYMGQSAPACALGDGLLVLVGVQAAQASAVTTAQATRRRMILAVLLAGVERLRRCVRLRVSRSDPPVEPRQGTRRPPVGAAEQAHDRGHDEDANDRGVDGDRDGEADPDG